MPPTRWRSRWRMRTRVPACSAWAFRARPGGGDDRPPARRAGFQAAAVAAGGSGRRRLRAGGADVHHLRPAWVGQGSDPAHPLRAEGRQRGAVRFSAGGRACAVPQPAESQRDRREDRAGGAVRRVDERFRAAGARRRRGGADQDPRHRQEDCRTHRGGAARPRGRHGHEPAGQHGDGCTAGRLRRGRRGAAAAGLQARRSHPAGAEGRRRRRQCRNDHPQGAARRAGELSKVSHNVVAGGDAAAETKRRLAALAVGAIGVVYGDIGTSPLYTLQTTLSHDGMHPTPASVYGVLSLIFWAQILVVSLKYVVFIMRADNKGEGGIMALMALAQRCVREQPRLRWVLVILGIFGAALFYGDGVITPAITTLGAVEGVKVIAPGLEKWVVPITVVVLILLFLLQKHGTERVGKLFGPVMMVWFVVIALLGVNMIVRHPQVLLAINPWYGVKFFFTHGLQAFIALGGVVLPSLVLNYFGQGALLLMHPEAIDSPFFKLVPSALLYPMIGLATAAAV